MKEGMICIDKPQNMTSHDVVAAVRRVAGTKRVGHTGTLDPLATGVLVVAVGRATRMIEYYDADLKTYRAEMKLGVTTDTLDVTGTVLTESDASGITEADVREALQGFVGEITQIPPKYSALKVNGKRLYEYAREGKDVEIKPRKAYIEDIYDIEYDRASATARFSVDCAKGTYVRTLCDDAGRVLGCGAVMSALERTASGFFTIRTAVPLERLMGLSPAELEKVVLPVENTLDNLGEVVMKGELRKNDYLHGRRVEEMGYEIRHIPYIPAWLGPDDRFGNLYRVSDGSEVFLGTGHIDQDTRELVPEKVMAVAQAETNETEPENRV